MKLHIEGSVLYLGNEPVAVIGADILHFVRVELEKQLDRANENISDVWDRLDELQEKYDKLKRGETTT